MAGERVFMSISWDNCCDSHDRSTLRKLDGQINFLIWYGSGESYAARKHHISGKLLSTEIDAKIKPTVKNICGINFKIWRSHFYNFFFSVFITEESVPFLGYINCDLQVMQLCWPMLFGRIWAIENTNWKTSPVLDNKFGVRQIVIWTAFKWMQKLFELQTVNRVAVTTSKTSFSYQTLDATLQTMLTNWLSRFIIYQRCKIVYRNVLVYATTDYFRLQNKTCKVN